MHLGYSRGTRENAQGVNVREQDVLDAATAAVTNLVNDEQVDVIVDLGDIAHVPAPKKRALLHLIKLIEFSAVPWYSANGNHTLQRTKSDLHLYDVLGELCPNFHGYVEPTLIPEIGAYVIPYGTEVEALKNVPDDARFIAGHFACDDVPWPGEHVSVKELPSIPTFLGHYHTRKFNMTATRDHDISVTEIGDKVARYIPGPWNINYDGPAYIGATERFAWGEWNNPTGSAVYDTETKLIDFIDHKTREWVDVQTTPDEVQAVLGAGDFEGKIVRLNIEGTPAEYHGLDIKGIRDSTRGALEFQIRRVGSVEAFTPDKTDTQTYSLLDAWGAHVERTKLNKVVRTIGERALASAGVIDA